MAVWESRVTVVVRWVCVAGIVIWWLQHVFSVTHNPLVWGLVVASFAICAGLVYLRLSPFILLALALAIYAFVLLSIPTLLPKAAWLLFSSLYASVSLELCKKQHDA